MLKKILKTGLIGGVILFIASYGSLFIGVQIFPNLFVEYINPVFNSGGIDRFAFFYAHPFILSVALAWFWERFKSMFEGHFLWRGLEFGCIYAMVALLPVMWITYSAWDVTMGMVGSWLLYGFFQSVIAGIYFAKVNP